MNWVDSSASSGSAPKNADTGWVAGKMPSATGTPASLIRVETLVVEIWPGVGALKPVPAEARNEAVSLNA